MAEQKRVIERLIGLVFIGIIALNYPFLALFSKKLLFLGVPLLYLYLFAVWFLFIIVLALVIPQGHKSRTSRQAAQLGFIPQGHKSRTGSQAAQLGFIPQGHKSRTGSQAAQLGFMSIRRAPISNSEKEP